MKRAAPSAAVPTVSLISLYLRDSREVHGRLGVAWKAQFTNMYLIASLRSTSQAQKMDGLKVTDTFYVTDSEGNVSRSDLARHNRTHVAVGDVPSQRRFTLLS